MSDIFISYKREEQPIARKLADALESEGWTVWWDPKLRAGERFESSLTQQRLGVELEIGRSVAVVLERALAFGVPFDQLVDTERRVRGDGLARHRMPVRADRDGHRLTRAACRAQLRVELRELLLDTKPMRGSKRIPGLEISASGQAAIDLWCNSGRGQVVIAADTITIIPGAMSERQCGPDQMRGDTDMLATLNQVTNWKREGNFVVLIGPKTLRFRPATN